MFNLFIDTNIFLNFYDFNRLHFNKIAELIPLIAKKQVNLFLTQQVLDEFYRNRERKLKQTYEVIKSFEPKLLSPILRPDIQEIKEIKKLLENIEKLRIKLVEEFPSQIKKKSLLTDRLIERIFKATKVIEINETIIERAKRRRELGNPPGKVNSYGDAINWECLLEYVPKNQDLFFITGDKDYLSPLDESAFSLCLKEEWKRKKNSRIQYYDLLFHFLANKFPSLKIRKQEIEDEEKAAEIQTVRS